MARASVLVVKIPVVMDANTDNDAANAAILTTTTKPGGNTYQLLTVTADPAECRSRNPGRAECGTAHSDASTVVNMNAYHQVERGD
jgi:hypothetical protein